MQDLAFNLQKRFYYAVCAIFLFAFGVYVYDLNFGVTAPTYYEGIYNLYVVYFLIIYKIIELPILYYILFHRNYIKFTQGIQLEDFTKRSRQMKTLFFLIPQGNIVFGIIAYKFSEDYIYYLFFSFVGLMTLVIVILLILKKIKKNNITLEF